MRTLRLGLIVLYCSVITFAVWGQKAVTVSAQDAQTCALLSTDDLKAATDACASAGPNSACLGANGVKAQLSDSSTPAFAKRGDQLDLAKVVSLSASVNDPASGAAGVAVMKVQTGTGTSDPALNLALFGAATLTSAVNLGAATMTTLPVAPASNAPLMLHSGASASYPFTLKLAPGQNAVVDGRNKAADWLRVRLDSGVAWTSAKQVKVTGDIQTLTELDDQNTQSDFLYTAPMQAFTLSTDASSQAKCGVVPSGLLVQSSGDKPLHLLVNSVDVTLTSALLFVRAAPKDHLEIAALTGNATVTALGASVPLAAGQWVRMRVGGKDGVTVTTPPALPAAYSFPEVDGAPISLLSASVPCTAGLPANGGKAIVRVGPGQERGSLFFMKPDANYAVTGLGKDAAGSPWWQIKAEGRSQAWVEQSTVHTIGACDQVAAAAAPPVIVAVPSGDTGGSSDNGSSLVSTEPATPGFAPTTRTIWQADPGPIQSTGACTGVPVAYCSQLVALTPSGSGLLWKGQELQPYYMARIRQNVYGYAGPNILGDARIQLTLVLTSPTTFTATQVMVMNSQTDCKYNYTFAGTFLR